MKKYGITARSFLTLLRKRFSSFRCTTRKNQHPKTVLTPDEKLILLCCGLLGKGEIKVRKSAKDLPEPKMKKCWVDAFPRYHYKELTVESENFALWIGFGPRNGVKRYVGEYLFCDWVILYFFGKDQRQKFIHVLENEETYCKLWDDSYTDIEENKFRITVGDLPPLPDLPYYLAFKEWKDERKKKYQRTTAQPQKTT